MADGTENVVDTLSIQINASATKAVQNLSKLEVRLRSLASATKNLSGSVGSIYRITAAFTSLSNASAKINPFINSVTKLSSVKISPETAQRLNEIRNSLDTFSTIPDASSSVIKLINALTRLASTGDSIKIATSELSNFTEEIKNATVELSDDNMDYDIDGFRTFANSVSKLSKVKIDEDLVSGLTEIKNGLDVFSTIPDVSSNITKLITALARLASTGETIKKVTTELPNFATTIRNVATVLSQLGGVEPQMIQLISSLGQLANVGSRMPEAAQNLRVLTNALVNMINSLRGVSINQDVSQLVSAIATLASSLGAINGRGGGGGLRTSSQRVTLLTKGFQTLGRVAKKALSGIITLLKKVGVSVGSAFGNLIKQISGVKEASTHMFTLSDGIKSVIGGLLGMRGITGVFNWLKEAVTAGGDITEIDHIVKSVFGEDMVGYVDAWANNAIEQFGIAAGAAKKYAGVLSSMFQASNIGAQQSGQMALTMVELASDLSSFYNIDTETAYQKIKSGLAGMVRPLRDLGIDLSVASLQQYALTQGITKSVSAMTQAEKVMLRYNYLLEVTKMQTGDYQRTNESFCNQLRMLKAYAAAVTTQFGVGLAAALRHVLLLLNALLKRILQVAQAFATLMQKIFGKYEGGASGIAMDLSDAEDYADGLADSADNASSGLGDAADSAKQLEKSLSVLPFDELHQLNKDNKVDSSGSGGGGTGDGTGLDIGDLGLDDALGDLESTINNSTIPGAISKWIERIKMSFQAGNFFALGRDAANMLNEGLQYIYDLLDPAKVKEKFEPYIYAFAAAFDSFIDTFKFDLLGATIARGINDIAYLFNTWYDLMNFERLGQQLANGLNGLLTEGDFYAWGLALGNKFMIAWDVFKGFVSDDQLWHNLANAISDGIQGITDGIRLGDIGIALGKFINGIATTLGDLADDDEMWQGVVNNIINGINKFISTTEWKDNGEKLNKFIQKFAEALSETIDGINWEDLGKGLGESLTEIKMGEALSKLAKSIVKALGDFIKGFISEPGGAVALGIIGGLAALNISSSIFALCFSKGAGGLGASIVSGLASAVGISMPTFGAMFVASVGQGILLAKNWDEIPTVTSGKLVSGLEKVWKVVNDPMSLWRQEALNGFETLTGVDIPDSLEKGMAYGFANPISTAASLIGEIVPKVQELNIPEKINEIMEGTGPLLQNTASYTTALFGGSYLSGYNQNIKPVIESTSNEMEENAEKTGENVEWRFGHGMRNTAELNDSLNRTNALVTSALGGIMDSAPKYGDAAATGYGRAYRNTSELSNNLGIMDDLVHGMAEHIRYKTQQKGSSTIHDYGAAFADISVLASNLDAVERYVDAKFEAIRQAAVSVGTNTKNGLIQGLQTHTTGLESYVGAAEGVVSDFASNVTSTMNMDLWEQGYHLMSSFTDGMNRASSNISLPHFSVSWTDYGMMSLPNISVAWYAKGGYFKGGNGQLVGIAENGKDEAVLPLENRRAMSMIADSIVSASNGMGLDTQDLADAIVEAMVTVNTGQQDPIFHIEVKTENDEVLARAVTRGQRSIDYRNNPTPRFAY